MLEIHKSELLHKGIVSDMGGLVANAGCYDMLIHVV